MQSLEDFQLDATTAARMKTFEAEVNQFSQLGPLDSTAEKKLQEYFRIQHIFHSTGIEGNRLNLQETEAVLLENMQIGGKPVADQQEVRDLDAALDYVRQVANEKGTIREVDIRELHRLVVRNRAEAHPGEYRRIGVVISGSEHKPPEPLAVPAMMQKLMDWLNSEAFGFPVMGATYVHHQFASIHPFLDGNGRLARLLMNLVLLRQGYPLVSIRREDRPRYYESLSFADVGLYSPLAELILDRLSDAFSEIKRVREETERMKTFAARWGQTEAAIIQRREEREFRQWLARMELIRLGFDSVSDLLDEQLKEIQIELWPYPSPDFSKFLDLREKGSSPQTWFFRIRMRNRKTNLEENFVFRFYRDWSTYPKMKIIPLQLNWDQGGQYAPVATAKIRLREMYVDDNGEFRVRFERQDGPGSFSTTNKLSAEQVAQEFFDDVLKECFGLKQY